MESPHPDERRGASSSQRLSPSNPNYKGRVRTGCLVCRARKVKCDEQRPSCQKCTRLDKTCVYKTPSRWGAPHSPTGMDANPGSLDHQRGRIDTRQPPEGASAQTDSRDYPIHEHQQPVFMGSASDSSVRETMGISNDIGQADRGLPTPLPADADESPPNQGVNTFQQGTLNLSLPVTPSDRFQQTSQLIFYSTTVDWLAASEVPTQASFRYFTDVVDCPFISPFDYLNWSRIKIYIAHLGLQQTLVVEALLAVQTVYRAQVDRLPMPHAMTVYRTAVTSFESILADNSHDFDVVLVAAFLLCLCAATLPNEDGSFLSFLEGAFMTRLENWLLGGHHSHVSLRISAWLQILNTATKRPGSIGLLPVPAVRLLYDHIKEVPSLSALDRDTHPENSLYDTVANPIFDFHRTLQTMSNRVTDVTHYRRSRNTPEDQAEVTDLMAALKEDLASLWENRPAPLRLQPDKIREHFSMQISDPLIALAGVCTVAYHAEIIVIGRILGDPPFPSPEAKQALGQIRYIVDGDWNASMDGALNPGYARPLFVYALENFEKEETQWAADRLRQIKHPISRSHFLASFVEAHGEAQRAQGRRVTMKYFCYQTFGVPLPFM